MSFLDKFTLGVWNVGIIESDVRDVLGSASWRIRWMKHGYKDRFFADPFLWRQDEQHYYIVAEEFPFYSSRGFISVLKVGKVDFTLRDKRELIKTDYHLSYPFVYDSGMVVPEQFRCGQSIAYRFDGDVLRGAEVIMDHGLIDQTFLKYGGYEYIFATDCDNPLCGLKLFFRECGQRDWMAHSANPVSSDIRCARPGGHFFTIDGTLYRPAQDSEGLYGRQIRIMQVDELSPEQYREHEVCTVSPSGNPPYDTGLHTFNAEDGFVIVDGYREYKSLVMKPLCLRAPRLMRCLGEGRQR